MTGPLTVNSASLVSAQVSVTPALPAVTEMLPVVVSLINVYAYQRSYTELQPDLTPGCYSVIFIDPLIVLPVHHNFALSLGTIVHGLLAQSPALFRLGAQFKVACMRAATAAFFITSALTGAIQKFNLI